MANVFRSKEVYKHPPKSLHDKNEIISVRGLYVTGEYRPPYYNENGLTLVGISSNKPKIVDFTAEYYNASPSSAVGLLDFKFDTELSIAVYGKQYENASPSSAVGLLDFDFSSDLQLYVFGKEYKDLSSSSAVGLLDFSFENEIDLKVQNSFTYHNAPEPCLRLSTIQTYQAEISNYIP